MIRFGDGGVRPFSRLYRRIGSVHEVTMPPLLLVHGIGMSHRYFDRLAREFPEHTEVLAVDLPGFGGTARPREQWQIGDYADHLIRVIEGARLSPIVLVGHSMGTQFVTEAAVRRPDLIAGVVLIGPVVESTRRTIMQQALSLVAVSVFERPGSNVLVVADYIRTGLIWYLTELQVMMRYRIEDRMPELKMPVLVMRGERDTVSRSAWCRELAAIAPDGEFVELADQPHVAQRSASTSVAALIMHFVWRTAGRA